MKTWMRISIVICALSAMPCSGYDRGDCLKYEVVSLRGTLVRQTYAGPPDYESITKGDQPQVIWILQLDRNVCVVDPDPRYPREYYEREVQLVPAVDSGLSLQDLLGARVIVTGKLSHGGARYDKRLVLAATEINTTGVLP
jgi:hypothetical protein